MVLPKDIIEGFRWLVRSIQGKYKRLWEYYHTGFEITDRYALLQNSVVGNLYPCDKIDSLSLFSGYGRKNITYRYDMNLNSVRVIKILIMYQRNTASAVWRPIPFILLGLAI